MLPLIEFVPEASISDEEALDLIKEFGQEFRRREGGGPSRVWMTVWKSTSVSRRWRGGRVDSGRKRKFDVHEVDDDDEDRFTRAIDRSIRKPAPTSTSP